MSTCISRHGEFGSHEPVNEYECARCGLFDEDALLAEVAQLRQDLAEAVAVNATVIEESDRRKAERDEARFQRDQERHGRKVNEFGLLAKLRDAVADRDSLAARLEAARFGCENCSDIERLGAKHFNDLLDARARLAEFETREEWAALDHGSIVEWATEEAARGNAAWLREHDPDARVMRRTVHTGPWREDDS